jgi:hypothetical protein
MRHRPERIPSVLQWVPQLDDPDTIVHHDLAKGRRLSGLKVPLQPGMQVR